MINSKRLISSALLGILVLSTVQAPVHAALTDWLPYFARRFIVEGELDNHGTSFANWWGNAATDADKSMTLAMLMGLTWFGFNAAFNKDSQNKSSSIFTLMFGLLGALGLRQWVINKMDQGTPELQRMGVNFNQQNAQQQEHVVNAASTLYNYFAPQQQPDQQQQDTSLFAPIRGVLSWLFATPAQRQAQPNNAQATAPNAQPQNTESAPAQLKSAQ